MKICWDNLENLRLTRNGNFKLRTSTLYEFDSCFGCKDPYLGLKNSLTCSLSCAKIGTHRTIITIQKISASLSGENSYLWKGGVKENNIPLYDTYTPQLELYEQCRRNVDDPNILEVKCTYCGKWYMPTLNEVKHRITGINGNDRSRFYCSTPCKQECPIFGKQKYYKGQEGYSSREVQPQLRQMVFERDGYTCVKCGSTGPLHCHHIDPVANNPIESADVDNCMTLCIEHHKEAHKLPGCAYNKLRGCI